MSDIIPYVEDEGKSGFIYPYRKDFYNKLGLTDSQIHNWCKKFGYKPYIYEIISCKDDRDLYNKYPKTWKFVRDTLEGNYQRCLGRTCFATAKDILFDGLVTDIILASIKNYYPELHIRKNDNDEQLELNSNAELTPDFIVNVGGKNYYVEMKITKNKKDEYDRSEWSKNTLTIRNNYNTLKKELFRYREFNTPEIPLMFLRINPGVDNEPMRLAVIGYDKFRKSKKDDSYYAFYRLVYFNSLKDMSIYIGKEIEKEIQEIK